MKMLSSKWRERPFALKSRKYHRLLDKALCRAFYLLKGKVKMPKLSALQGQNVGRVSVMRKWLMW